MKAKSYVILGLMKIFSIASIWSSNLDLHDQINKANLVKLASAEILKENVNKVLGNHCFLERTQLHNELGGTSKYLKEIDLAIDLAIYNYAYDLYESNTVSAQRVVKIEEQMFRSKPLLRKALLMSNNFD